MTTIKIGLEIHCQLTKLRSKLFCSCRANYRNLKPNENICPVCIGLPGTLPIVNKKAILYTIFLSLALNCAVSKKISFFRKNYFYPDLPKNFQITQFNINEYKSIGNNGNITIRDHTINIERIQLEEDPGRIIYNIDNHTSLPLIDYNRSGTPLIEIVTKPDFKNSIEIREFLNTLTNLLIQLNISNPHLTGAMRTDVNISVENNQKVEIKNIDTFHDLNKIITFEITRQQNFINRKIPIKHETRHWDHRRKITVPARNKENEDDYRYFIENDIPIINIPASLINKLKKTLPENNITKTKKYIQNGISHQVISTIFSNKYYQKLFEEAYTNVNGKMIASIITTDLIPFLDTEEKCIKSKLNSRHLIELADSLLTKKITRYSIKNILPKLIITGKSIDHIIKSLHIQNMVNENDLMNIIDVVLLTEPNLIAQINQNHKIMNHLIGSIMKKTKGNANPDLILKLLQIKLTQNIN